MEDFGAPFAEPGWGTRMNRVAKLQAPAQPVYLAYLISPLSSQKLFFEKLTAVSLDARRSGISVIAISRFQITNPYIAKVILQI